MNQFLALAGAFSPPATSPAAPPPPAATAPAVPGACPCGNRGACAPASPPPAPAAPPAPRAWQLRDNAGQTWTHADKATLEAYVAARNAASAYPTYYQAAPPPTYSRCGPRGCR